MAIKQIRKAYNAHLKKYGVVPKKFIVSQAFFEEYAKELIPQILNQHISVKEPHFMHRECPVVWDETIKDRTIKVIGENNNGKASKKEENTQIKTSN